MAYCLILPVSIAYYHTVVYVKTVLTTVFQMNSFTMSEID